jgi:hypothetical protein
VCGAIDLVRPLVSMVSLMEAAGVHGGIVVKYCDSWIIVLLSLSISVRIQGFMYHDTHKGLFVFF